MSEHFWRYQAAGAIVSVLAVAALWMVGCSRDNILLGGFVAFGLGRIEERLRPLDRS